MALFSYGSLKHLLALTDGTLNRVSQLEFQSRLQHLVNTFEIVCLGSELSDFDHYGWQVAREYDSRVLHDIEVGLKEWTTLNRCIDPTCWTFAKQLASENKSNSKSQNPSDNRTKVCTTFIFFRKQGTF